MATRRRDRKKENAERKSPAALQRGVDREVRRDTDELDDLLGRFDAAIGNQELPTAYDLRRADTSADMARVLRQLSADASAFAACLPDPTAWKGFFSTKIRPTFNSVFTDIKMCIECGRRFPVTTTRNQWCSDGCRSRTKNRGVKKTTAEEKLHRLGQKMRRHVGDCRECQTKRPCAVLKTLIATNARLAAALEELQQGSEDRDTRMSDDDLA